MRPENPSGGNPVGTGDRTDKLAATGPDKTHEPENLAFLHVERHTGKLAPRRGRILDLQHGVIRRRGNGPKHPAHLAANHGFDDGAHRNIATVAVLDLGAIAHDGDAVGHLADLLQPVGHVDDTGSVGLEILDLFAKQLGLGAAWCGRRLVEDQETRVERKSLADLDQLLCVHGPPFHLSRRREIEPG